MVNFLQGKLNKPTAEEADSEALRHLNNKHQPAPRNASKDSGRIVVEGVGNLMHHIARCCQPIPGDQIIGFITQGRGYRFTVQIVSSWLNWNPMHRNGLSMQSGAKATPAVIRWWCGLRLMTAVGYCAISLRSWQMRKLTYWALPAAAIPKDGGDYRYGYRDL